MKPGDSVTFVNWGNMRIVNVNLFNLFMNNLILFAILGNS